MAVIDAIALGIERDLQHLKALSQNVANVNTPGYQAVQSFDVVVGNDNTVAQQQIAPQFGAVKDSDRSLDWAIASSGYFVIEKNDQLFVSRYGRFHVSQDGWLTHVSGGRLVGESGAINVGQGQVSVSHDGQVLVNGQHYEQLKVVDVSQVQAGQSGGLYSFSGNVSDVQAVNIKSNAINVSNVDSAEQMTNMINLNRHVQSLQKAALAYDQMMNAGINELGRR
ncbi:flagellar basal body rod C-terminal domain-containing protein [Pseudoalteromonas sp. MMG022]|uniref:flagellar basal body rod C-terminal domain-containing protein n=1 Tax=Pseudoalteromonas sp. MMG022 TaxID=2909978 RepID=UPI001F41E3DC|nr:flagellar basal body rod C-terminal domain-containing protein [Pseudoalteromonas sp. MMG022]MCF6436981.1 hypothetical protein [Pseudoalteromonas sp. MMG022]